MEGVFLIYFDCSLKMFFLSGFKLERYSIDDSQMIFLYNFNILKKYVKK